MFDYQKLIAHIINNFEMTLLSCVHVIKFVWL